MGFSPVWTREDLFRHAHDHGRWDEETYSRVEPVLRELGTPTRIGDNGQGLVLKLAINISLAVQMLAFCEGLLLAQRDGIDLGWPRR
ncbi:MAG TPA: hypothetical protein VF788_15405 [Pseudonocardiaceae bacterium]|jgi:3-hydroxyisobutyrate dehydrogenase-like beta-hydroxyacid dehydrogenase